MRVYELPIVTETNIGGLILNLFDRECTFLFQQAIFPVRRMVFVSVYRMVMCVSMTFQANKLSSKTKMILAAKKAKSHSEGLQREEA